jgi:hypothetical protein
VNLLALAKRVSSYGANASVRDQFILERNIMSNNFERRDLLKFASAVIPMGALEMGARIPGLDADGVNLRLPIADSFPGQPVELVREMVTVAHFDLKRVKELVESRPSLAKASWDWGFGDWESALGAASHMGNRPLAEYLISKGARPSIFSAAMLGQLDVVKAFVAADPGVQRIRGPHSISLLSHAKNGGTGARSVYDFLQSLGDADVEQEVPLADEEKTKLLGTYIFGIGVTQQVEVLMQQSQGVKIGVFTWMRKGSMGRPIYHLGKRGFYPAGAPDVRIRFAEDGTAMVMTVNDGEVTLIARRT